MEESIYLSSRKNQRRTRRWTQQCTTRGVEQRTRLRLNMVLIALFPVFHTLIQLRSVGQYSNFFSDFRATEMNRFGATLMQQFTTTKQQGRPQLVEEWLPSEDWLEDCIHDEQQNKSSVYRKYSAQWPKYQLGDCLKQCTSCARSLVGSAVGNLSVAGEYWRHVCGRKIDLSKKFNITFISNLFQRYESNPYPYSKAWPRPHEDELVIHLRIGDILDFPQYSGNVSVLEMLQNGADTRHGANSRYPNGIKSVKEYLSTIRESGLKKVVLRGGTHFPKAYPKSRVFTACLAKSIRRAGFNITSLQLDGEDNPDQDFFYMSHAKHFVMATGGYSRFIAQLVEQSGGKVVGRLVAPLNVTNTSTPTNVKES